MSAGAASAGPLLEVEGVEAAYGRVQALRGVSLLVGRGEIVTLIGANGAGKTTLMMTLCGAPGAARLTAGRVRLDGVDVAGWPAHRIMRRGITLSPEGRRVFGRMTVAENLRMGAAGLGNAAFEDGRARAVALFPRLGERMGQRGGTLSGGEQQMLAIARALMSRPRLLLLDEPSLGLAPLVCRQIFAAIATLNRDEGMTVLLVEQNATQALRLAHRGYVLVRGTVTMQGAGDELLARPEVRAAYLEGG